MKCPGWSSGAEFLTIPPRTACAAAFKHHRSRFRAIPWMGKDWRALVAVAGWLIGLFWEVTHLVHGSDLVCQIWRGQQPAQPAADIPGCEISGVGHAGLLALPGGWWSLDGCLLRQCWRGCPRPLTSLPQVGGGDGLEEMGYLLKEREQEEALG